MNGRSLEVSIVGVSYRTAPIELRECFSDGGVRSPELLSRLHAIEGVEQCMFLSTCNRSEVIALVDAATFDRCEKEISSILLQWVGENLNYRRGVLGDVDRERLARLLFHLRNRAAIEHLFHVASGLDSAILGEAQILGQLKQSLEMGWKLGTVGPTLERIGHRAIRSAKRVRTETGIGRKAVSIGYAATELAKQIFGELQDAKVLLVGAGETAGLTIRHLHFAGARDFTIANRSYDRAQMLAATVGGIAVELSSIAPLSSSSDILIFCASVQRNEYLYSKQQALKEGWERRSKPRLVIDLGLPRNVDPALRQLDDIFLYTVDDLHGVIRENLDAREIEAREAARLLEDEVERCLAWLERLPQEELIARMWQHLAALQDVETERFRRSIEVENLSDAQKDRLREAFYRSSGSLLRKVFARSMVSLRDGSRDDLLMLLSELQPMDLKKSGTIRAEPAQETATAGKAELIQFTPRPPKVSSA